MAVAIKVPGNPLPPNNGDETPADPESVNNKEKNWAKGKKRKNKLRDHKAPRQPLTGYVRFLNHRREILRTENPKLSFTELIKMLAQEWSQLPAEEKRPYQEAGEQDRERYMQELSAYKQTEAYKQFSQQQQQHQEAQNKKQKIIQDSKKTKPVIENNEESKQSDFGGFDIPIFTEEFLDHNKAREAELRQLRKSSTDYESQNASLGRIVESLRTAVSTLEVDTATQRANNAALSRHLDHLRASLASAFQGVALPDTNERPTMETIDNYINRLHSILLSPAGTRDNPQLFARVAAIVEHLDVQG